MLAKLACPPFRQATHVGLRAELEAAGRTRFDARRFEALSDAVRAQRAFVDLLRRAVELRNIERTTGDAVLAADAVLLIEIDDPVGVLHDGPVGRTCAQAPGIFAVHALVLAHQPLQRAVLPLMRVELDAIPVVPRRRWHGTTGISSSSTSISGRTARCSG